jgi:hypothetical protein
MKPTLKEHLELTFGIEARTISAEALRQDAETAREHNDKQSADYYESRADNLEKTRKPREAFELSKTKTIPKKTLMLQIEAFYDSENYKRDYEAGQFAFSKGYDVLEVIIRDCPEQIEIYVNDMNP